VKPSTCFNSPKTSPRRNRRESALRARVAVKALAPFLLAVALAWPASASADPAPPPTYRDAVEQTIAIVSAAPSGDIASAQRALSMLESGTGRTQPEIIADLTMKPPDFGDASTRLNGLLQALDAPATTAEPAQAQQQLHRVLTMHRYDSLHQPPSVLDTIGQWIRDRITDLLRLLFGGSGNGLSVPTVYFYVLGAVVVALAAFVIFRATRGRLAESALSSINMGPRAPADFFAEADRLAASGDRVGAIRALCAGVAATLAGEQTWEGSPLTVREIFEHASEPARLRPLLFPFEAAIYGGREVDAATYQRAELAAAPFRKPLQAAAA
jgi:hypothetical protein